MCSRLGAGESVTVRYCAVQAHNEGPAPTVYGLNMWTDESFPVTYRGIKRRIRWPGASTRQIYSVVNVNNYFLNFL